MLPSLRATSNGPRQWLGSSRLPPAQSAVFAGSTVVRRALFLAVQDRLGSTSLVAAGARFDAATRVVSKQSDGAKPRSGWNLYLQQHFDAIRQEMGLADSKDTREVSKEVAKRWKALPTAEKQVYKPQAAPARKLTGYNMFQKEAYPLFQEQMPHLSSQDITRHVAAAWKALSDEEKEIYKAEAEKRNSGQV